MKLAEIRNIGPIQQLSIPLPECGGVVVLRGRQGDGKSTALRAVAAAAGKSTRDLSVRDGQKSGSVEIGGVTLSVSRARQTKRGELEVEAIEGRFDIGRLVDPQIADEERADASRIKQLLALTGATASREAYDSMISEAGYDPTEDIDVGEDETDDPIALYALYKRACDQTALAAEKEAAKLPDGSALGKRPNPPDVDTIREEHQNRTVAVARLRDRREAAEMVAESHRSLTRRLADLEALTVPSVAEAELRVQQGEEALQQLTQDLADLQAKIVAARSELREAKVQVVESTEAARSLHETRAELAKLQQAVEAPTDEQIASAVAGLDESAKALQDAILANREAEEYAIVETKAILRLSLELKAKTFRSLASRCESILAQSLPESELRVDGSRLVCSTDRSPCEPFGDLSHGERSIIAIRIVAQYLPPGGIATISQEIWSGISPANQEAINAEARARGVVILTADVADEDLKAEVM